MDELKVLQLQLNDRPSTSDVSNMMEGISHTFRKYVLDKVSVSVSVMGCCCLLLKQWMEFTHAWTALKFRLPVSVLSMHGSRMYLTN